MTMPNLMNCPHSGEGWCLECVGKLQAELDAEREKVTDLECDVSGLDEDVDDLHDRISELEDELADFQDSNESD